MRAQDSVICDPFSGCDDNVSEDTFVSPREKNGKRGREIEDESRQQENEVAEGGGGGRQDA